MKTIMIIVTFFSIFFGSVSACTLEVPHVSVQGSASRSVTPDELTWRLSVRNVAKETSEVAKVHMRTLSGVVAYLKKQGIDEKDIQTTHMQLSENKQYRKKEWIKEGYFANSQMTFKLKNLKKYVNLWKGLAQFSEVSMSGFSYGHSDDKTIKNELQQEALRNAKDKASQMASTLDSKIGKPLAIEETVVGPGPVRMEYARAMSESDQSNLATGTMEFTMAIRVTFELTN